MLKLAGVVASIALFVADRPVEATDFFSVAPCRVLDTRNPDGPLGGPALVAGADGMGDGAGASAGGMDDILIEELELGVRSYNCLKRAGIQTVGDLVQKSESELAAIPNFGRKSIEEVRSALASHGLTLKGEELLG